MDIILIIISSAGLLHGILFAIYLCTLKKKQSLPNYLLALILIFMAFRIGKSVLLNFGDGLETIFIFIGLAFLLLIGPLLKYYIISMLTDEFEFKKLYLVEFIPFLFIFLMSFFTPENLFETKNQKIIIVFGSILIFIYLHFATYIIFSYKILFKRKNEYKQTLKTKSQKTIFEWLTVLITGFVIIWLSYFLNIIEDSVPYVIGPIMYSIIIYYLSYKAFQYRIVDLNGDAFKKNDDLILFDEISKIIVENELFLENNISLKSIGKLIGKTTQKTSEVINQYSRKNFNDYINYYRIEKAKEKLSDINNINYTISSIAFDVGFSSLSSFNGAFKKFEGITPSLYRKANVETKK